MWLTAKHQQTFSLCRLPNLALSHIPSLVLLYKL